MLFRSIDVWLKEEGNKDETVTADECSTRLNPGMHSVSGCHVLGRDATCLHREPTDPINGPREIERGWSRNGTLSVRGHAEGSIGTHLPQQHAGNRTRGASEAPKSSPARGPRPTPGTCHSSHECLHKAHILSQDVRERNGGVTHGCPDDPRF